MHRDDYKQAIDKIHATSKLKNETLIKVTKRKSSRNWIYVLSTAMIAAVIAVSIVVPIKNNKKLEENDPIKLIADTGTLPKVENFENFKKILKDTGRAYNRSLIDYNIDIQADAIAPESIAKAATNSEGESQTQDHSTTNVQVEGVDEADIVKTDGEYIYYLADDKLVIVNAKDAENLKIENQIDFENFNAEELYINKNNLVVIGTEYEYGNYYSYNNFTIAKQYNIENKEKPKLEREVKIEGIYISSRMIENNIYLISNKTIDYYLDDEDLDENEFKPKYQDTIISKDTKCMDFDEIYYIPKCEETRYLNLASFNLEDNSAANIQSFLGAGEEVYASINNLYIAITKYEYKDSMFYGYYDNYDVNTYIYKFEINGKDITYKAASKVKGSLLNQFSMDESDGYFRIATTDETGSRTDNNIYVLNENLEIVGKVENLAKGEKIYSVRFMQNRAYMVTFVETDPLFVIDLSEPTNPQVLGELKIPGYSKYLHPYDETHLIGFGENTKVNEYGGVVTDGIKMALFDVSDPTNPTEMFKTNIGTSGTYSELLYNHKALMYSKEKNLMAFPVTISKNANNYRSNLKFQGAMIYNVDLENGFILKGMISHKQIEDGYMDYDYTKNVERIIYIGNNIFTLSKGLIKVTNLDTMDEIESLEIETKDVNNKKYPLYDDMIVY